MLDALTAETGAPICTGIAHRPGTSQFIIDSDLERREQRQLVAIPIVDERKVPRLQAGPFGQGRHVSCIQLEQVPAVLEIPGSTMMVLVGLSTSGQIRLATFLHQHFQEGRYTIATDAVPQARRVPVQQNGLLLGAFGENPPSGTGNACSSALNGTVLNGSSRTRAVGS